SAGVFLALSKEAIAKLQPVGTALALGGGQLVHDAFGGWLASASELFGQVRAKGVDLEEYRRRFDGRDLRVRVPKREQGEPRPAQRAGVQWRPRLASWAPGCVLADDMGLGKPVQTAAVLKALAKTGPALIVAPASVSSNWVSELARFVPSLRVRW